MHTITPIPRPEETIPLESREDIIRLDPDADAINLYDEILFRLDVVEAMALVADSDRMETMTRPYRAHYFHGMHRLTAQAKTLLRRFSEVTERRG